MTLYLINCSKGFVSLNGCLKAPRKWSIEDLKGMNKEVKKGHSTLLGKRRKKKKGGGGLLKSIETRLQGFQIGGDSGREGTGRELVASR